MFVAECVLCQAKIAIQNEKKRYCHICETCSLDSKMTVSKNEAEKSFINRDKLEKLYFGKFIFYSRKEFDCKMDMTSGLSISDLSLMNDCEKTNDTNDEIRKNIIKLICKKMNLKLSDALSDSYVNAFISYNLIIGRNLKHLLEHMNKYKI